MPCISRNHHEVGPRLRLGAVAPAAIDGQAVSSLSSSPSPSDLLFMFEGMVVALESAGRDPPSNWLQRRGWDAGWCSGTAKRGVGSVDCVEAVGVIVRADWVDTAEVVGEIWETAEW
jgi:hypothetical protein